MNASEKISALEKRIAKLREQMDYLLSTPGLTPSQRDAVTTGHQMNIDEIEDRISHLKRGLPDPYE